ncbi:putrescine aminotransferase [Psychromonas sp. MME1]|uniref:putrescine aminotransferase n=1 Tax=Psychromonas sp. MME1 TaxID=3231032 RepID=UPI0034E2A0A9
MDYSKRDINEASLEANKMVSLITKNEQDINQEERIWIAQSTYENFENHINKGFLEYRKSVTETEGIALTDWTGQGSILKDVLGREFIDMLGGYGLYSPGIKHPKIVAAAKAQLERSPQYSQEMLDPLRAHLAKVIAKLTPGDIQYGFFANSGTEAVDGAMKLAKMYTGKKGFISTLKAFHGKSLGALSLLGKAVYREPLGRLLDGVRHVPFGDADAVEAQLKAAEEVGDGIAAVIAEPIQGEAGAIVPPDDYWPKLRQICDKYDVLLIADEVQTGFGRTGKIFGVDHWDVTPDIMCFGKALGGGVIAMSGFFASAKLWKVLEPNPFMHTTTTGGNPIACAAALAQISVLLEEDLAGQAAEKGTYIKQKLAKIQELYPEVLTDVTGRGLLLGMVFANDEVGFEVVSGLFKRGILIAGTLNNSRVVRIEPALNVPYPLIDKFLVELEDVIKSL